MKTGEVAALLGVSGMTVRNYCEQGLLKCKTNYAGHRTFDPDEVQEFLTNAGRVEISADLATKLTEIADMCWVLLEHKPLVNEKELYRLHRTARNVLENNFPSAMQ